MKAYKGFFKNDDGTLRCRGFIYEEGKTYELPEGEEPWLCHTGFHACTFPMDVFWYYNSDDGRVEFHEVELEGVSEENSGDSKVAGRKITIGREITPDEMVEISIRIMLEDKEKYFGCENTLFIKKDNKSGYIDRDGKLLSDRWFDRCGDFSEGFADVRDGEKCNYIRKDGTILSDTWYDSCYTFNEGKAIVINGEKRNFIDTEGKLLCEEWFDWVTAFREGFAVVNLEDSWNFIDTEGKLLSETWFDSIQPFDGGVAEVKIDGKWTTIDKEGKIYEGI